MCDMFGIVPCARDIDSVHACLLQFVRAGSFQKYIDWVSICGTVSIDFYLFDDQDE